jgi:hypothetical protein
MCVCTHVQDRVGLQLRKQIAFFIHILASVTLGKFLNLSEPELAPLQSEADSKAHSLSCKRQD